MKLHRFYVHEMHNRFGPIALGHEVWIHDEALLHQWLRVLRYKVGDHIILFNDAEERLYEVDKIDGSDSVRLRLLTDLERSLPSKKLYLLWSVLKKDKNDWVLQKATELGVHKCVPIIADRSEKTGLQVERAHKIVIEAAEQCGRSDIPEVREPIGLMEALQEYADLPLFICEQHNAHKPLVVALGRLGVLIGPEGGWSDAERQRFVELQLPHIALSQFTLRAETAAIIAVNKLSEQ